MLCRPITLCLLNCTTGNLQVAKGHMLSSPAINNEIDISLFIELGLSDSLNVVFFYKTIFKKCI
jgi:hypothetical protein